MAAYETTKSARYAPSYGPGQARQEIFDCVSIAIATAMIDNANDDIGLLWVPKGAVITAARFDATDIDGATAMVWDIGDASTEDRLFAAITTGQAAGSSVALAATGWLYKYTARTQLRAFVKTASGTPATGTIKFGIWYFVDESFDNTALVAA